MQVLCENFQRVVMAVCAVVLAALFLTWAFCVCRAHILALAARIRTHYWKSLLLSPLVAALLVWGGTKPVTPTVRGITLGTPMETPTSVALEWCADEGREIRANQLVRLYWRDAVFPAWKLAAEGYGITNAVVHGFFINRDTDWIVEVEDVEGDE